MPSPCRSTPADLTARVARRGLPRRWRHALLAVHIGASVALLGDSAAFLGITLRARTLPAAEAHASYDILGMLSVVFGIPFSFVALGTGIALGLGTRWGVFRYPWVIAKLALLASVMVVGGAVLGPAEDAALDGSGAPAGSSPAPSGTCSRSASRSACRSSSRGAPSATSGGPPNRTSAAA